MILSKGISVCFVIKNGMINGYPFWESLTSSLPFANEIVIGEGYSTDGTYEAILKFREIHGKKVKIFRCDWDKYSSEGGNIIAKVSHEAMSHCKMTWIYYLQADEIIHPLNVPFIRRVVNSEYNSVSFLFHHFSRSWKPMSASAGGYNCAIRMVRVKPFVTLIGDGWTFGGEILPILGPNGIPKPIYHFSWVFPKNIDQKSVEHGKIYPDIACYQQTAAEGKKNIINGYVEKKGLPIPEDYNDYPDIMKRLLGAFEYTLPPEIFGENTKL